MTRGLGLFIFGLSLFAVSGCDQVQARFAAKKGHDSYLAQNFNEAVASYEEASKGLPNNPTIARNLGYSYLAAAREEVSKDKARELSNKAIDVLSKLLNQNPKDTELAAILLDTWEQNDRMEEAASFFKTRVAADPKDIEALRGLGVVELKRGNYQDALVVYEKRKALNPDDLQIYPLIAETCWQWLRAGGPNDLQDAIKLATKGVDAALEGSRRDPKNASVLVFARLLLMQRVALQKDLPAEVEKDLLAVEGINKKIEELMKNSNAPKAGQNVKP